MWIHARLQGARLGQSHCPCLLIAVTYLLDDSQNQRRAQTLQHRGHSDLLDPLQCRGRMRSQKEDQAIPQQRYPQSQTESRHRMLRQVKNGPGMPVETYHQRIKEEKRMAAVEAAMALFLEQGYDRTSLQQVAQRAELSTGTLFKRFPTKASLFEAIVEQFWKVEIVSESP